MKFEQTDTRGAAGYSVTEGKEIVDVKGKQVEAEWVEASTNSDETVVGKLWTAQDVRGGIVKQTVTKRKDAVVASQSDLVLVEYLAKPEKKAAAKD